MERYYLFFTFLIFTLNFNRGLGDLPCVREDFEESFVCVCNETYCDEIAQFQTLGGGEYVMYSTSRDSYRFEKTLGNILSIESEEEADLDIFIDRTKKFQTVAGFGGAITDAAGINIKNVSADLQKQIVSSYFSESGIEYNILRVPIGGTDFSTHFYGYNEFPEDDVKLTNFTLTQEDYNLKVPVIKDAINASPGDVWLIGAVWSPPTWMKVKNGFGGLSRLNEDYYQTYADYHVKFLDKYREEGLVFWAISTGNEPSFGVMNVPLSDQKYYLGWSPADQAKWLIENLSPSIRNSDHNATKILGLDDQRSTNSLWLHLMSWYDGTALNHLDGVAVHFYVDKDASPYLHHLNMKHSDKFIISTEACVGENSHPAVLYGSWTRAEKYIKDIMLDLNYNVTGWLDWNIALNEEGGPTYNKNFVDAPIIVRHGESEIYKQPLFYSIGHFSKFIPRGSVRVDHEMSGDLSGISTVTFERPDGGVVIVLYNDGERERIIQVSDIVTGASFTFEIGVKMIKTIVYNSVDTSSR